MKRIRLLPTCLVALFLAAVMNESAFADLNANEFVSRFNSLNGGAGYFFTNEPNGNLHKLIAIGDTADTSAYASNVSGSDWFYTLCAEPGAVNEPNSVGTLNYSNNITQNSEGAVLTLGAAYLYKQFATGALYEYDYNTTTHSFSLVKSLQNAMQVITNITNWGNDTYLKQLLAVNGDQSHWTQTYDPGKRYDELGEHSVFVMNVVSTTDATENPQDFLYLAKAASLYTQVPEATMLLFWTLGALALGGATRHCNLHFRRRQ